MISRKIYKIPGSPTPPAAVQIDRVVKMVKISVDLWSENDLKNKFDALSKKEIGIRSVSHVRNQSYCIKQIAVER